CRKMVMRTAYALVYPLTEGPTRRTEVLITMLKRALWIHHSGWLKLLSASTWMRSCAWPTKPFPLRDPRRSMGCAPELPWSVRNASKDGFGGSKVAAAVGQEDVCPTPR